MIDLPSWRAARRSVAPAGRTGRSTPDPVGEVLVALRERSRRCLAELNRLARQVEELQREIDAHTAARRPGVPPPRGVRANRAVR